MLTVQPSPLTEPGSRLRASGPSRPLLLDARPHGGVALESGSKGELKDLVPSAQMHVLLDVSQLVPYRGGGGVALLAQHSARGLHVLLGQPKVLLNAVEHRATCPCTRDARTKGEKGRAHERRRGNAKSRLPCGACERVAPPAWMQKKWIADLKEGTYRGAEPPILWRTRECTTLSCSERGRTRGPSCVRLIFIALPATCASKWGAHARDESSGHGGQSWVRAVWRVSVACQHAP